MIDPDSMTPLDDDFIDLIVDGLLTPTELRAAIDRLDSEPDGWKRCTLAFLEAQCWRESFRALEEPPRIRIAAETSAAQPATAQIRRRSPGWRRVAVAAGIAAISFAMGWIVHPARPSALALEPTTPVVPAIAIHQETPTTSVESPEIADASQPEGEFVRQPEPNWSRPDPIEDVVTVASVRVGYGSDNVEVPILAGPNVNEEWLRDQPPRLDEYQRAVLERQGYQVDQHRRIITATLADGRRVTLPFDQVQLRYTGNNPL